MEEYIEEKDIINLKLKRKESKIKVKCYYCSKIFERWLDNAKKNIKNYEHIICPSCMSKIRNSKMDWDARSKKIKETAIKKYGSVDAMWAKRNQTTEKIWLKKYGVKHIFQAEEVKEKIRKTSQERYGVDNAGGAPQSLEKAKKTFMKHYGVDNPWKSEEIKEKIRKTNQKKYGVDCFTQTQEYQCKAKKRYTYQNIQFDSSWELAFFIYCKDHNYNISRNISYISYKDSLGKNHRYFPDFIVNGQIIEIKGGQFYTDKELDGGIYKNIDAMQCKLKVLQGLNIKIISNCEKYLNYVEETYGKNYLQQFRNV